MRPRTNRAGVPAGIAPRISPKSASNVVFIRIRSHLKSNRSLATDQPSSPPGALVQAPRRPRDAATRCSTHAYPQTRPARRTRGHDTFHCETGSAPFSAFARRFANTLLLPPPPRVLAALPPDGASAVIPEGNDFPSATGQLGGHRQYLGIAARSPRRPSPQPARCDLLRSSRASSSRCAGDQSAVDRARSQ